MSVYVAHLVLVAPGDAGDQVRDEGPHRPEGRDILADTVVDLDADDVLLGEREADGEVVEVLGELPCNVFNPALEITSSFPKSFLVLFASLRPMTPFDPSLLFVLRTYFPRLQRELEKY